MIAAALVGQAILFTVALIVVGIITYDAGYRTKHKWQIACFIIGSLAMVNWIVAIWVGFLTAPPEV